jgi:hypothetical protein
MTDAEREKWCAVRQRGRLLFVVRAILTQGLVFATLMTLVRYLGWMHSQWRGFQQEWPWFVFYALFFGIWMGVFMWYYQERRFREATKVSTAMKPTAPSRYVASVFATTPSRGLSYSR